MRTTANETLGARPTTTGQALVRRGTAGVTGGLAGGVVFGLTMQAGGVMPMVAALVGSDSSAVGWGVHLLISVFFGVAFAVVLGPVLRGVIGATLLGVGYGAVLWVAGPLLLMPARPGMLLFVIDGPTLQILLGHLVSGLVLGAVVGAMLRHRGARSWPEHPVPDPTPTAAGNRPPAVLGVGPRSAGPGRRPLRSCRQARSSSRTCCSGVPVPPSVIAGVAQSRKEAGQSTEGDRQRRDQDQRDQRHQARRDVQRLGHRDDEGVREVPGVRRDPVLTIGRPW